MKVFQATLDRSQEGKGEMPTIREIWEVYVFAPTLEKAVEGINAEHKSWTIAGISCISQSAVLVTEDRIILSSRREQWSIEAKSALEEIVRFYEVRPQLQKLIEALLQENQWQQ